MMTIVAASSTTSYMPAGGLLLYGQKKQELVASLKKNLIAYAADARWDELKPYARPALQGNSPSFIGLILAPADFSKGRPAKQE